MKRFDFTFEYRISPTWINHYGVIVTSLQYETFKLYVKTNRSSLVGWGLEDKEYRLDSTPNIIHVRTLGKEWSDSFIRAYGVFLAEQILLSNEKTT